MVRPAEISSLSENENISHEEYDYSFVDTTARIARYDDFRSAPQITEITAAATPIFIENLTVGIYTQAQQMGGLIPYTVIREVSENFIHAQFKEIVVSIYDKGNTIRFADQGPGIEKKDKAQLPGFSSAIEPMKAYIRGVGSGFPIVKEYLNFSHGSISIEDNLNSGAVITISLTTPEKEKQSISTPPHIPIPPLSVRDKQILELFQSYGALGVSEISKLSEIPLSSVHNILKKLEESGIIQKTARQKRELSEYGEKVLTSLS